MLRPQPKPMGLMSHEAPQQSLEAVPFGPPEWGVVWTKASRSGLVGTSFLLLR